MVSMAAETSSCSWFRLSTPLSPQAAGKSIASRVKTAGGVLRRLFIRSPSSGQWRQAPMGRGPRHTDASYLGSMTTPENPPQVLPVLLRGCRRLPAVSIGTDIEEGYEFRLICDDGGRPPGQGLTGVGHAERRTATTGKWSQGQAPSTRESRISASMGWIRGSRRIGSMRSPPGGSWKPLKVPTSLPGCSVENAEQEPRPPRRVGRGQCRLLARPPESPPGSGRPRRARQDAPPCL
jgi:hypothetical protein